MTDSTNPNEILSAALTLLEVSDIGAAGADLVVQGGVEGILEVAASNPEMFLTAFTAASTIMRAQSDLIRLMLEESFEIKDRLDNIIAKIDQQ